MKQLLTAITMVLVASAASAETQMVQSKWMSELTLWDVVWEDDAPRYQKWLLDKYDTAEEAGSWRINKLKAAYKFNVEDYPGTDTIFNPPEELKSLNTWLDGENIYGAVYNGDYIAWNEGTTWEHLVREYGSSNLYEQHFSIEIDNAELMISNLAGLYYRIDYRANIEIESNENILVCGSHADYHPSFSVVDIDLISSILEGIHGEGSISTSSDWDGVGEWDFDCDPTGSYEAAGPLTGEITIQWTLD